MLDNVRQKTIKPIINQFIAKSSTVFTDEYNIYSKLQSWGYSHKTVCHSAGEFARDEDRDGFHEVHVNTMEGFWSLLRSDRTEAFLKLIYLYTWHSSSSFTTSAGGGRGCCLP